MPDSATPAQPPSGHPPARVVTLHDPAADAWRTMARVCAWIALVVASAQVLTYLVNLLHEPRTVFGAIPDVTNAFRRATLANRLFGFLQLWSLLLTATLGVGAVATLVRRRWGPTVLLAYALGKVPDALVSVLLFIVQNVSLRQQYPQMVARPLALELVMYVTTTLGQLAFPAVLFMVMSRPAVRRQFAPVAPRSAFEPLTAAPAPRPAQR